MNPIHEVNSISSISNGSVVAVNSKLDVMRQWKEWAQKTEPGRGEQRDIALYRVIECCEKGLSTLDLSNLNLTDLPKILPDSLWDLFLSHNQLTHLPENLPNSLREIYVSHNQLTHLPESLPSELAIMDASYNQITCLPKILPDTLNNLNLSNNALTELTSFISRNLQDLLIDNNQINYINGWLPYTIHLLSVSNNNLTSLPENLPFELRTLNVNHNRLTHLPANLPPRLDALEADHNQLIYLSENLPSDLSILNVSYNQLTHPPVNLPTMMAVVNISHNHIGIEAEQLFFVTRALYQLGDKLDVNLWKTIAKENNAGVFFDFLHQLFQGDNASSVTLKQIVSTWLKELSEEENVDLRVQTFAIAKEGTETCVDRASFYFNQMYSLMVEHRLIKSDPPIPMVFQILIGLFRLQELEKIATEHTIAHRQKNPDFGEDIEIYLAYQYCLREPLGLPIYTELQFGNFAKLTESDLNKAKSRIMEEEKQNFIPYLINDSEVWKKKITNWNSNKVKTADEIFLVKIEEMTTDATSVHFYDVTVKNRTDKLHYEIYFPLTEAFLKENNMFSLLEGFHY